MSWSRIRVGLRIRVGVRINVGVIVLRKSGRVRISVRNKWHIVVHGMVRVMAIVKVSVKSTCRVRG